MDEKEKRKRGPRGRYKQYAEPEGLNVQVPKQTKWNSENLCDFQQAAPCTSNTATAHAAPRLHSASLINKGENINCSAGSSFAEEVDSSTIQEGYCSDDNSNASLNSSTLINGTGSCSDHSDEEIDHDANRESPTLSDTSNSSSGESTDSAQDCRAKVSKRASKRPRHKEQTSDEIARFIHECSMSEDDLVARPYVPLYDTSDIPFPSDDDEDPESAVSEPQLQGEPDLEGQENDQPQEHNVVDHVLHGDDNIVRNAPIVEPHKLLKKRLAGEYSNKIIDTAVASKGEILLNALEFSKRYSLPAQGVEDLHKLVNSIFYKEVIPETKHKIDTMYTGDGVVSYFFFCSSCFEDFGQLDYKKAKVHKCGNCGVENRVSDLTKACYYVTFNLVYQLELLLNDPNVAPHLKSPQELTVGRGDNFITDLYDGEMYKKFAASLDYTNGTVYLSLTCCTDGTPIFKSSDLSIWPLFAHINELPPRMRMSNILLIGLWFCHHPKMKLFLNGCVDAIAPLAETGFEIRMGGNVQFCKCYVIAFCVDSGARGSIQCIHSHNGESGCNWCLHPGEVEGEGSTARKYRNLNEPSTRRTVEEVEADGEQVLHLRGRNRHINGVLGLSPLLRLPKFDIVNGMILDILHWASFGIARQVFKLWMGERKTEEWDPKKPPPFYIGAPDKQDIVNQRINNIRPPLELRRMPRSLTYMAHYSAREYENIVLYLSIPMLKNILPEKYLKHWCKFVQAFYLLMKTEITPDHLIAARVLMKEFLIGVEELYGWKEMTFNMHISEHAVENVERWGNLWSLSTYAFENANGNMKNDIHAQRGIPHQLIRKLGYDSSLALLRAATSTAQTDGFRAAMARKKIKKCFYIQSVACVMPSAFSPSREEEWLCRDKLIDPSNFSVCKRIIVHNICYSSVTSGKTNNSVALLKNGKIVQIRKIICSDELERVCLFVSVIKCTPYPSQIQLPFLFTVQLVEQECHLIDFTDLDTICVSSKVNCSLLRTDYISVLANAINVF